MRSLIVMTSVSVETTTHLWFSSGIGSRVRNRTLIGYGHIVTSWSHFKSLHCNIWNIHKEWSHIRSSIYPPKRSPSHPPLLYHIVDSGFLSFPTILSSMRPRIEKTQASHFNSLFITCSAINNKTLSPQMHNCKYMSQWWWAGGCIREE